MHRFVFIAVLCVVGVSAVFDGKNCEEMGRFADPSDCHDFLTCAEDANGSFRMSRSTCGNYAFDEETGLCADPKDVPGCSRSGRNLPQSNSEFNRLCDGESSFVCASCTTLITCSGTEAYEQMCSEGFTCGKSAVGDICQFARNDSCSCTGPSPTGFYGDPHNKDGYFRCDDEDVTKIIEEFQCPDEKPFNKDTGLCEESYKSPPCTKQGIFAVSGNCSTYYSCVNSRYKGMIKKEFDCDPGLQFDQAQGMCVDECTLGTSNFECTEEGRFSDPLDCSMYYDCVPNRDGTLFKIQRSCPAGDVWTPDSETPGLGGCLPGNGDSCPTVMNKCIIPESCNST